MTPIKKPSKKILPFFKFTSLVKMSLESFSTASEATDGLILLGFALGFCTELLSVQPNWRRIDDTVNPERSWKKGFFLWRGILQNYNETYSQAGKLVLLGSLSPQIILFFLPFIQNHSLIMLQ